MTLPVLEGAVLRFCRRFQNRSGYIEQPPMVAAPNARLFYQTELQGGACVATMEVQKSDATGAIAEHHQVLAQDTDTDGQVPQLVRMGNRLPEAPEILTARSSRDQMGQLFVLIRYLMAVACSVLRVQKVRIRYRQNSLLPVPEPVHGVLGDHMAPLVSATAIRGRRLACRTPAQLSTAPLPSDNGTGPGRHLTRSPPPPTLRL